MPGELSLPKMGIGTLLVWDIAQLTPGQQMQLYDWMTDHPEPAQVICLTSMVQISG